MRHANGMLDIAVWPTELRSGVFNLWSANLVLALLPLIDPGQKSQVNCIVGRFDLKDGDLADDEFLIDTSTVRIRGTGHANLKTEEIGFVFRPRAKGTGLFRLQTPLRVSGTLSDQRFGFDPRMSSIRLAHDRLADPGADRAADAGPAAARRRRCLHGPAARGGPLSRGGRYLETVSLSTTGRARRCSARHRPAPACAGSG